MKEVKRLKQVMPILIILSVASSIFLYVVSIKNGQSVGTSLEVAAKETFLPATKHLTLFIINILEAIIL